MLTNSVTHFFESSESTPGDILYERAFRAKVVRRPASVARSYAVAGQLRSLSKDTPLQKQIKRHRAVLKRLLAQQKRQLGSRARSAAMRAPR